MTTRRGQWPAIFATSWAGSVAFLFVSLQPMILDGLVRASHMSFATASSILSANIFGSIVGTFGCLPLMSRTPKRFLIGLGAIVATIAQLVAVAFVADPFNAAIAMFIAGIGSGVLGAGASATVAAMNRPSFVFAVIVAAQIVSGAAALYAAPWLLVHLGIGGLFAIVAAATAGILLTLRMFIEPAVELRGGEAVSLVAHASPKVILLLLSLTLVYVANNAVWAFLVPIAAHAGLNSDQAGTALAIGQLMSLGGAIAAGAGERLRSFTAIVVGLLSMSASGVFFVFLHGSASMSIAVTGFLGSTCFVVPFYLAILARADALGRLVVWGNGAIAVGLALGPPIAALFVSHFSLQVMILTSAGSFIFALLLIVPAIGRRPIAVTSPQ